MKALEILTYMKASLNDEEVSEKFEGMNENELETYLDEAIEELQSRSCDGCVHLDRGRFCTLSASNHCIRDAEDYFELKEQ